ncbi:hypothetical protein AAJ76_900040212 [Vairimorpha ceranae]|uniref:Uncharacterized protein n=1 Tax=Vairimorpha ceranae TaxID=40302 RepID=A0A0F9WSW5_9MICR|nr:hypothetical protein AAJ76_900040212 [Vairimorpha ceranae]KKO75923.1 hypothetical protein AAJ76_900040212 [Vairimorpha ceranae]
MKLLELIEGGFIAKFVNSIKKSVSISSGLAIINDIFSTAISGRKSLSSFDPLHFSLLFYIF